jgi:hypothetical protein
MDCVGCDLILRGHKCKITVSIPVQVFDVFSNLLDIYDVYHARILHFHPLRRPGFEPGSGHVGFVVDKVALRQVFSEYFGFPCQSLFH